MSRAGDEAFIRWARRHSPQVFECLYCGWQTQHYTRTCPVHRDLVLPTVEESVEKSVEQSLDTETARDVPSATDGETSGVGGAGVASDVASGAPPDSRRVDSGSA